MHQQKSLDFQITHFQLNSFYKLSVNSFKIILNLLFISQFISNIICLYNFSALTTPSNKHGGSINVLKINSDHTRVYTGGSGGQVRVWNFSYPILTLHQVLSPDSSISWWNSECLYIWNNGQKFFFGSAAQVVKIYSLNIGTGLYITTPVNTPSVLSNIHSISVNSLGTTIYVSLLQGCKRLDWNGSNWIFNTPLILTSVLGTNQITYIELTSNQQKIITFDLTSKQINIFKMNGSNYQLHQTINTELTDGNCILSFDEKYISCYGTSGSQLSQFNNYILDTSTDLYLNVTVINDLAITVKTQSSYIDSNNIFGFLQRNSKTYYKYKLSIASNVTTYTILDKYTFSIFPTRIAFKTLNTPYQLIGGEDGNVYLLVQNCNNTNVIPHCAKCIPDNTICNQCQSGYDLISNRCDNCLPGYYPNGIFCQPCGINCLNCSNLTTCSICTSTWTQTVGICDTCAGGYYINGTICSPCGINCQNCSSLTTCSICVSGWILSPTGICDSCNIGLFNNGTACLPCQVNCDLCINSVTCTHCVNGYNLYGTTCCKNGLILINSTCSCPQNMIYSNLTQQCECLPPFSYISGICGNFPLTGFQNCILIQKLSNSTLNCLFCSLQSHQIAVNYRCVCQNGYQDLNNTGACTQKCGDGLLFQAECDDNNINSNDGCSSNCLVQQGFICDRLVRPSLCKSQIMLRYSKQILIMKSKQAYEAQIQLKILNPLSSLPFPLELSEFIRLKNHISLFITLSQNPLDQIQMTNLVIFYIEPDYTIHLKFNYNFTIQNFKARIQLDYQNTKYFNYTQQIKFDMKGSNLPLFYSNNISTYKSLSIINYIGTIFCILILAIGLLSPKLIGLQMVLTLQLIYISQILIKEPQNWPIGFLYLKDLKYSMGYNQIEQITSYTPQENYTLKFYNIDFNKRIIQNFNYSYLLLIITFFLALFLLTKRLNYERSLHQIKNKEQTKSKGLYFDKQQTIQRIQLIEHNIKSSQILNQKSFNVISQISLWCILPCLTSLGAFILISNKYVKKLNNSSSQNLMIALQKFICLSSLMIIFAVCCNSYKNTWLSRSVWNNQLQKIQMVEYKKSLFCYLVIIGVLIIFFNSWNVFELPMSIYVLALHLSYICILIYINPYKKSLKIHTVGLFINNLVYLVFLIVINLINLVKNLDQIIILALGYMITFSCSILVILGVIRLYYQYRYGQALDIQLQKQRKQQQQLQLQKMKLKNLKQSQMYKDQAKNKLNQIQKIRAKNDYLIQNQINHQDQQILLKWLQKRSWNDKQKEQYYYKQFYQKPLSWMKQNNINDYEKQVQDRLKKKNQELMKMNKKKSDPLYNQARQRLKKQQQINNNNLQRKLKYHEEKIKRNMQYVMNVTKDNNHKLINPNYQLKN